MFMCGLPISYRQCSNVPEAITSICDFATPPTKACDHIWIANRACVRRSVDWCLAILVCLIIITVFLLVIFYPRRLSVQHPPSAVFSSKTRLVGHIMNGRASLAQEAEK